MMNHRLTGFSGLITLICCALFSNQAAAATMLRMEVPTLVEHSDSVVIGSVTTISSKQEPDGRVYTTITLHIDESLKGQKRQTLTIRQLGGRDLEADIATVVPGMPQFEENERVLLFLQDLPDQSSLITGMAQGKFRIARGPDDKTDFIIPQLRGLNLIDAPATDRPILDPKESHLWHQQTHPLHSFRDYLHRLIELEQKGRK